jgi:hypothetical protein
MIKTSLPNKTMYRKLSFMYLPMLLQNDTSTSESCIRNLSISD